jgi:hypothetical protein
VNDALERLVDSLLYEGYALYPYTPGATKNATPTPFGIVYPPAYAGRLPSTFAKLRVECLVDAPPEAELHGDLRFLAQSGERHQAVAQRVELEPVTLGELVERGRPLRRELTIEPSAGEPLSLRIALRARQLDDGRLNVAMCVHNCTAAPADLDRAGALRHSLLSTHPILQLSEGRFISPLDAGSACESVNTWPVLAGPHDDAVVGAAIVLPDHPQLAPESRANLFDGTEIEEALLLHVQALSDGEREEIARQDPAVRDMLARADAAARGDIMSLHGRVTVRDPVTTEPPTPSAMVRDPSRGEDRAEAEGKVFTRGAKVLLRPGADADLHARMLDGRTATVERIYVDYDGKVHLGVTVDDDPGQDLMRETGRFLFFFAPEVEVLT